MATTVESPGITSAKEEAAAILYARQPQNTLIKPVMQEKVDILPPDPVQVKQARPSFASYHSPEPMPVNPRSVDTVQFKPYKVFDEVKVATEPQVIRPYIDSSDYLASAVAATSVATPEALEVAENTATISAPTSVFDTELEENTQYVVKFKNSTIVAATIIATIFLLLSILCVVNIVSLVTTSAQVNALMEESTALHQTLEQEKATLENARQQVDNSAGSTHTVYYVTPETSSTAISSTASNSSFFDWLCHSLSHLFS